MACFQELQAALTQAKNDLSEVGAGRDNLDNFDGPQRLTSLHTGVSQVQYLPRPH